MRSHLVPARAPAARSLHSAVAAAVGVVVILVVVGVGVGACTGSCKSHMGPDSDVIEADIKARYPEMVSADGALVRVDCPPRDGSKPLVCKGVMADGRTLEFDVRFDGFEAHWGTRGILVGKKLAEIIRERLQETDGIDFGPQACPDWIPHVPGETAKCTGKWEGVDTELVITVTADKDNDVTFAFTKGVVAAPSATDPSVTLKCPRAAYPGVPGTRFTCVQSQGDESAEVTFEIGADGREPQVVPGGGE